MFSVHTEWVGWSGSFLELSAQKTFLTNLYAFQIRAETGGAVWVCGGGGGGVHLHFKLPEKTRSASDTSGLFYILLPSAHPQGDANMHHLSSKALMERRWNERAAADRGTRLWFQLIPCPDIATRLSPWRSPGLSLNLQLQCRNSLD